MFTYCVLLVEMSRGSIDSAKLMVSSTPYLIQAGIVIAKSQPDA
jgi:hypothetical protein